MKRAAFQHTKVRRLMRVLNLPLFSAVGILECLWNLTSREAPQGNIGKLSDDDIADAVGWEKKPSDLIESLVLCGWIERSSCHRLIIHDWQDHADDTTKKSLQRSSLPFLSGNVEKNPDKTPLPCQSLALPEPKPEPEITPAMVAKAVLEECAISGRHLFNNLIDVCTARMKAGDSADFLREAMVSSWQQYELARSTLEYAVGAEKFFGEGVWLNPAAWPRKNGGNGNGKHETRNQRILRESLAELDQGEAGNDGGHAKGATA